MKSLSRTDQAYLLLLLWNFSPWALLVIGYFSPFLAQLLYLPLTFHILFLTKVGYDFSPGKPGFNAFMYTLIVPIVGGILISIAWHRAKRQVTLS